MVGHAWTLLETTSANVLVALGDSIVKLTLTSVHLTPVRMVELVRIMSTPSPALAALVSVEPTARITMRTVLPGLCAFFLCSPSSRST